VLSNTGSWMQRVAQDWLVLELTHGSGTALGITTGLQFLPMLASPWGGVVADRYPKRVILMVTQVLMGALAAILGVLALTGAVRTWHVYLLALALGMVAAVDNPTRQAFAAEMVGKDAVANAIALNSAVFSLARIVGPAVAGLVISIAGVPAAFLVNAASYGAALAGLKLMRPAELYTAEPGRRSRGQLRESVAYVAARPELWIPLTCVFFVSTFGMNFQVTNALMSREVFHTGARLLVVPGDAGANRSRGDHLHHHGQLRRPVGRRSGYARQGHGPVPADVPRRGTAGLADGRLDRRAVRAEDEPGLRRADLSRGDRGRGNHARPSPGRAAPPVPPARRASPG